MQTQIRYIQDQFGLNAEEAESTWLRIEQDVTRFALEENLEVGGTEYLSLTRWYAKALLGESTAPRASIVKSFKQYLLEQYNEQF